MKKIFLILTFFLSLALSTLSLSSVSATETQWTDQQLNVQGAVGAGTDHSNPLLDDFIQGNQNFFFSPGAGASGAEGVRNIFTAVAYNIKNVFIYLSLVFLLIGVIKLLFSSSSEEDTKKWKSNIIWVSVGIVVMQLAYSVWMVLYLQEGGTSGSAVTGALAANLWTAVLLPLVKLLQMLASFGFVAMAIYAFYIRVTAAGGDEGTKKGNNILIYSIIGFILVRIPEPLVKLIYGNLSCSNRQSSFQLGETCLPQGQDLSGTLSIFGKFITWMNGFLFILSVILVIYAGWLILISAGDDEKLKKAKQTILYIAIGLLLLVAGHAIFRFFVLEGM